jgi:hypothetical protein
VERPLSTLILSAEHGDGQASEELFAALYRELRGLARRELARSGPGAAIGVTSLLHEAYLDIAQLRPSRSQGRRTQRTPTRLNGGFTHVSPR